MSCNVGNIDRIVRAILGVILIIAPFLSAGSPVSGLLVLIGIVLIITAIFGICPLYHFIKPKAACKA